MNSQGNRICTLTATADCMESAYVSRKTSASLGDLSRFSTGTSNLPSSTVDDVTIPWLIDLEDEPYGVTESPSLETVTEPTKVSFVDSLHVATTREPEVPCNGLVPNQSWQQLSDQKLEAMHKGRLGQLAVRNTVVLGTGLLLSLSPVYSQRGFLSAMSRDGRSALCALYCSYAIASLQNPLSRSKPKRVVMVAILATLPFAVCCSISSLPFAAIVLPLSAAISGLAINGLSAVQSTYLTSVGVACAIARDCRHDAIIMAMTSFVAIMQQLAQLLGHLVTSTVYQLTENVRCASALHAQYFNKSDTNEFNEPNNSWPLLTVVYVTLTTSGLFFVCWYLEPIDVIIRHIKKLGHVDEKLGACRWQSMVLLSFLSVYMGSMEAFIYCDITELLMCQFFDLPMIGYVIMCFTACDVAISALAGVYVVQKRLLNERQCTSTHGAWAFIGLGAIGHASVMLAVFLWQRFVMQLSDEIVRLCAVFLLMATVGATTAIWRIMLFRRFKTGPVCKGNA